MKRVYDPEQLRIKSMRKLYDIQKNKSYNYHLGDFVIEHVHPGSVGYKWKHKDWKTWMQGLNDWASTQNLVADYILECFKPYGYRDFSKFHLA